MEQSKASLRAVFCDAVEIPDPVARAAFLDSACAGDPGLRGQVERLLAADSNAGDFFSGRGDTPSPRELFSEQPGERIGRYRLIERIGRGGGGAVYLAEQEEPVRRRVALKILMLGMDTRSVVARFEAERQALAMMDHPNIAKVLDAGATETGRPFFVMELVSGQKLSEYCERKGLSIRERLELFIPVCRAVQHAHQKGIVHRDLKPSNILVTENEGAAVPKVIDFGIAKATQQDLSQPGLTSKDQFLGTPAYMSPEQVEYGGRDIDTRSDIYSLGVILYELLTGKPPFDPNELMRAGLDEMRRIIREVDPPKPSTTITKNFSRTGLPLPRKYSRERLAAVCGDMDWIAMKCLEKDRARRYETANGLAMDIRRHLDHEPVLARPPSQIYRFQKIVRRHRLGFGAAGIISLVLVAAVLVSSQLALRARRAEREQSRLRGVAENKATESRQRLVRMNVTDGNRLAEQGDPLSALPWFVEALQMELDDPGRAEDSRLRISAALQQAPRLEHMIFHGRWINWIVFSPDGTRLATGANEYAARIWDAHTGELVLHLARQRGQIRILKFSPDGKKLVTLDHTGTACLWDAFTGERLGSYLRPKDYAVGLLSSITSKLEPTACFSPDGKLLLVAWSSKSAGVWDASNQSLRHLLTHEQVVYHASFSPDGRYIVSCSQDGLAKIWDAQTGEPVGNPLRHSGPVAWAQFSPDGQSLLSVTERKRVQVWDWRKGRRLGPELRHDLVVFHASFSPDGRQILTASWDMLARIWDLTAGQIVAQFEHPSGLVSAAFAPDGKRIATACHDGVARVWEIGGSGRQRSLSLPHGNEVDVVVFSPDGQQVAVGGRGGVVRLWGLAPEDAITWKLPGRDVVWAEFSKDGGKLVTAGGGLDPNVCIWDGRSGKASGPQLSHSFAARKAIFNADGSRLLTIGEGRTAHLWNATTGQESIPAMQHANRVNDAAISPDNHRIATVCNDRAGYLWDATTGQRIARMPHSNGVTSVAFSPDGRVVATGARDRSARIWKAASGEPVSPPLPQPSTVRYLRFSPDGRRLATACYLQGATHGIAQLWDVTNGKPIGAPMTHRDDIRTVEFSSDGRWIATASGDHTARVWDALTGEPVSPLLSHQDAVLHAIFTPDGRRLATLAQNGEVRLWNALTGEPITMPIPHPHNHGLGRLSFSPNGRRLLIATGTDLAYARQFDPDPSSIAELLVKAQAFSGRQIHVSAGSIALDSVSLSNAWQQLHTARSRN